MIETKYFEIREILSVTTERLLTKPSGPRDNGIGRLYEILGWMTNDSPCTHQLGRFMDECRPWLLRWFPELEKVSALLPSLDLSLKVEEAETACTNWVLLVQKETGAKDSYTVPRIPKDDHEKKDPYDELVALLGTDEGVVIIRPNIKL